MCAVAFCAPAVPRLDHRVEELLEHLVGLLVACSHPHRLDVRVAGVIHARLDALRQRHAVGGRLVLQLGVHLRGGAAHDDVARGPHDLRFEGLPPYIEEVPLPAGNKAPEAGRRAA